MDFPVFDLNYIILGVGLLSLIAATLLIISTIIALTTLLLFWKTKKILVPRISLAAIGLVETPLQYLFLLFGFDKEFLSSTLIDFRNRIYKGMYANTPYPERAIFIPQCLRHPNCPAPLTPEGIKCISCGLCGIYKIMDEAESRGYKFFITPGSSLIKRMIKKYRPKAILGVGCNMEVKEGIEMMAGIGLPVEGVVLQSTGCVNTRVSVEKLMEMIKMDNPKYSIYQDKKYLETARSIEKIWSEHKISDNTPLFKEKTV